MSFTILSRDVNLNQHILCEASAGTGKTFTIEHLFVRRLITAPKCSVRDIAVLTFTNAVASELVLRLKRALDSAIDDLRTKNESAADYILAIIEQGTQADAASALEIARDELEFAAIDTIHGFCYRCLTEYATGVLKSDKSKFATGADVRCSIEEFFRVGLSDDICVQAELKVLLTHFRRDFALLQEALTLSLWDDSKVKVRSVKEIVTCLEDVPCEYSSEEIVQGLLAASEHFNGIRSRSGELKTGAIESIEAFGNLANKPLAQQAIAACIKDPLFASELFSTPKAKSSGATFPMVVMAQAYEPYLMELAHSDSIFERLRVACKKFVSRELERRGLYCLQELLIRMERDIQDARFRSYLQKRFSCVIVDEFQDTDPHQWNIIQTLFVNNWHGVLYLVGDPKQAIYSFRQADVYCYMQAKNLENQAVVTLSKNFRSSPDLVSALNTLFCGPHTPNLFVLPKLNISLDVPTILSGGQAENLESTNRGAVHFFTAASQQQGRKKTWPTDELERDCFYSFIAEELKALKNQGISYSSAAILVKDRYQALKVEGYLHLRGIPALSWRKKSIVGSPAHLFLERMVACLLNVRDRGSLIDLVVQPPFTYSSASCQELRVDLVFWAEHVTCLLALRKKYETSGFAGLVQAFLQSIWPRQDKTIKELLWQDKEFLYDLEQLVEECQDHADTLDALQEYLHTLKGFLQTECDQLMSRYDPQQDAVQILTLHASKGLEFDVVFALGLANRPPAADLHHDLVELDCEKLRQFYVACTRAKRRLYLPVAEEQDAKEVPPGQKAPMELFLEAIKNDNPLEWLSSQSNGKISSCRLTPTRDTSPLEIPPTHETRPLVLKPQIFRAPLYSLTSFTKRSDGSRHLSKEIIENELPAGIEAGILVHELLGELLQSEAVPDTLYVQNRLLGTVFEGFEQEVLSLLQQALTARLGSFALSDVDRQKCFVEAPFYSKEEGSRFVQGAIDLFFEHEGKFYLLDWKSNLLESYGKAALQQEIKAQGYTLQASIYTDALLAHLGPESVHFGGFFFVFLRGLQNPESKGVLFLEPTGGQLCG